MSLTPKTVPTGAIRYNTDSNKMECFNGTKWMQVAVSNRELSGGARLVMGAGHDNSGATNVVQYLNIASQGNAIDFGDVNQQRKFPAGFSDGVRGIVAGGKNDPIGDTSDYLTLASTGNGVAWSTGYDWYWGGGSHSSSTRGIQMGAKDNSNAAVNTISYCTIATTGNANDFGDLTTLAGYTTGTGSPTRAFRFGGSVPSPAATYNTIDYVTIATLGNAQDFGDLTAAMYRNGALSGTTRALLAGGESPASDGLKIIDYIEMSTLGNAIDFGDRVTGGQHPSGGSNCVRGVWAGLQNDGSPWAQLNVIEYNTIATQGDAVDFGDLATANMSMAMLSTNHGGL